MILARGCAKERKYLDNQRGSVLIIALLVLTAVTIIGVLSIHISTIENRITKNRSDMQEVFYLTESTVAEAMQKLMDAEAIDVEDKYSPWHHPRKETKIKGINFRDPSDWQYAGTDKKNCEKSAFNSDSFFAAVEWDVASGGSLVMTQSRLYMTRFYGLCEKSGETSIIEVGYYMRYGAME